jgi:uncharacterized membrane protein
MEKHFCCTLCEVAHKAKEVVVAVPVAVLSTTVCVAFAISGMAVGAGKALVKSPFYLYNRATAHK